MSDGTPGEGGEVGHGADEAYHVECWQATLDDSRTITAWDMGDGSFVFRFKNMENITKIRLSRDAVNAMKALMLCKLNGLDA